MPEEPKSPLSAFTVHARAILGLAAAVAGAVFGTAHWAFYEQLDVRPSDVGLGPAEILAQAAVGLVLTVLIFAFLAAAMAFFYWAAWSSANSEPDVRLGWEDLVAAGVVGVAVLVTTVGGGVAIALVIEGPVALILPAGMALIVGLFVVEGWRDGRRGAAREATRRGIAVVGGAGFALLAVPMAALVAIDDAHNVRRGVATMSVLHPLAGGPVTCVEPKPSPATTRYLLHLGTGDTHEVLYQPGRGPVRVPAGDVVLLPAEPSKCRPSS